MINVRSAAAFVGVGALAVTSCALAPAQAAAGDTKATATAVAVNTPVSDRLESDADVDWFRFTVTSRHQIVVTLSGQPQWADVRLFNADSAGGAELDSGHSDCCADIPPAIDATARVEAGTYFVAVEADGEAQSPGQSYQLRVGATPRAADLGPNVDYAALPVIPSQLFQDTLDSEADVDWVKFDVAALSDVTVTLAQQPKGADLALYRSAAAGGEQVDKEYSDHSDPKPIATTARLTPGTYLAQVAADYYWDDVNPYSLHVAVTPVAATIPAPAPTPSLTLATRTLAKKSKLRIDVGPDSATHDYRFSVQRRAGGKWRNVRTGSTAGAADTAVVNQRRGTYRVVVPSQFGATGVSSRPVRVVR